MGSSAEHGSSSSSTSGRRRYHAQYTNAVADHQRESNRLVQFIFGFVPQCGFGQCPLQRSSMSARESFSNRRTPKAMCRRWTSGTASVSGTPCPLSHQQGDILRVGQDVVAIEQNFTSARCSGYSSNILLKVRSSVVYRSRTAR